MSSEMKVEVFRKERITPSSPTPHHLRNFRINLLDQFAPSIHFPALLFYPKKGDAHEVNNIERAKLLKTTLSETLTSFYPFAGRFQDYTSVCCNDEGVTFLEAQVNCPISRAIEKPHLDFVKELIPNLQSAEGDLLLVQANFFDCGGVAIGFHMWHMIADAFTFVTFLNRWAAAYRGLQLPPHQYVGAASRFPPVELSGPQQKMLKSADREEKCSTRIFLFESSKIESLKSKAASAAVPNPTRVEVLSALIWKCAMKASAANSDGARPSSSVWMQAVNLRKILKEPSAENLMGNLVSVISIKSMKGKGEDDIQSLVAAMRKGLNELISMYGANGFGSEDIIKIKKEYGDPLLGKHDIELYNSTSWCRLPIYETDFGWGKPLFSRPDTVPVKNLTVLMDCSDGRSIAARLTLKEKDMVIFEKDEELLAYAVPNPSLL